MIEPDKFLEWKQHPVTEFIMQKMRSSRDNYLSYLTSENLIFQPNYAQAAAKWAGSIEVIEDFLNIKYVEIQEDEQLDEEQK